MADFRAKTSGRCNTKLAGVCAWASGDINNCAGTRFSQPDALEFPIKVRQIRFAHPSQHNVLFHRRADIVPTKAPRDICQLAALSGRHVPQRKRDRCHRVAGLALLINVRSVPRFKTFRPFVSIEVRRFFCRSFLIARDIRQISRPSRIFWKDFSFFQHESSELFKPQLRHKEFKPGGSAILLLT